MKLRIALLVYTALLLSVISSFGQTRPEKLYYDDGSLKAEGDMSSQGKENQWTFYYPTGTTNSIEHYRHDTLHGEVQNYDFEGHLIAREQWQQGLQQDSSFYYHPNGSLEKQGIFEQGLYQGTWKFYYENGQLKRTGTYQQGLPEGAWTFYHENGELWQTGHFSDGKESGDWKFYTSEGNLEYTGQYEAGERTGDWYYYNAKGKKKKVKIKE